MKTVVAAEQDCLDGGGAGNVLAALQAGRDFSEVKTLEINGIPYAAVPAGVSLESMEDTMTAPVQIQKTETFEEPDSFCCYVKDFKSPHLRLYGKPDYLKITGVLDDHMAADPQWCKHTAILQLTLSPEWKAWHAALKEPHTQSSLAEFFEGHIEQIAEPDAGDLLSDIRSIHISTNTKCESVQREGGDISFAYATETAAGTKTERGKIPSRLTLIIAPFRSWEPVQMVVTLTYRLTKEKELYFIMQPLQSDELLYASYADVRNHVQGELELPVLV